MTLKTSRPVTTLGLTGGALAGWWLWLKAKAQRLEHGEARDVERLSQSIDALRAETEHAVGELHAGQQELHERLDFAERLLTRGKEGDH